jgi:hypothetical protein
LLQQNLSALTTNFGTLNKKQKIKTVRPILKKSLGKFSKTCKSYQFCYL